MKSESLDRDCVICSDNVFDKTLSDKKIEEILSKGKSNGRWYTWLLPVKFLNLLNQASYQHTCNKLYHLTCLTKWKSEGQGDNTDNCPNCQKSLMDVFTYKQAYNEIIEKIRVAVLLIFSFAAGYVGNKIFSGNALGVAVSMVTTCYLTHRVLQTSFVKTVISPAKMAFDYAFCWSLGIEPKHIEESKPVK